MKENVEDLAGQLSHNQPCHSWPTMVHYSTFLQYLQYSLYDTNFVVLVIKIYNYLDEDV